MTRTVTIGITDCSKYLNYERWMQIPGVSIVKLSKNSGPEAIQSCDGIVLTGGEDVHPRFYHKPEYLKFCEQDNMDEQRDEFELQVLKFTQQHHLPVLGICRGLQVANVFFGGTLIPDIPSAGKPDHAKVKGIDRYHTVKVEANSILNKITGEQSGEVNSAHHQAVDRVGNGLVVNAVSGDGIIEGLERKKPEGNPFLLLVQWHPERMSNPDSVFTRNIRSAFVDQVNAVKQIAKQQ